jgi:hypothetical protein
MVSERHHSQEQQTTFEQYFPDNSEAGEAKLTARHARNLNRKLRHNFASE